MLSSEKMATSLFEAIMEAANITLRDLAHRAGAEQVAESDFPLRFESWERFLRFLQEERLPERVARLEAKTGISRE